MTLVVLGTVETPYWEHNPGSREHVPGVNPILAPILSAEEAAEAIFRGVAARKRTVVKPADLARPLPAQRVRSPPRRAPAPPRHPQADFLKEPT